MTTSLFRRASLSAAASARLRVQANTPTQVTLRKSPQCNCEDYAAHLRRNGFAVGVRLTGALATMSRAAGTREEVDGCHIAAAEGCDAEGHVPAGAIRRLSAERPRMRATTPAGTPLGTAGTRREPFCIHAVAWYGSTSVHATI